MLPRGIGSCETRQNRLGGSPRRRSFPDSCPHRGSSPWASNKTNRTGYNYRLPSLDACCDGRSTSTCSTTGRTVEGESRRGSRAQARSGGQEATAGRITIEQRFLGLIATEGESRQDVAAQVFATQVVAAQVVTTQGVAVEVETSK